MKALFTHNLGGVVVFGTDNLLIAHFIGIAAVGLYSNYLMVVNALKTVYDQLFRSVTASVGNLGTSEELELTLTVFWNMNFFGCWLYGFSSVCLAVLLNPFITRWMGETYLLSQGVVWLIALNFYVRGMRKTVLTFREAYGLYWYDQYKHVAESAVNLIASVVLATRFGIAGILTGTVISTMTICFWIEPVLLFKHAFHISPRRFFRDYAVNVVWTACAMLPTAGILSFIAKMALCTVLGSAGLLIAYFRRKEFRILSGSSSAALLCLATPNAHAGRKIYREGSLTMVELFSEKSLCCGCMACADICPKNAVAFTRDPEGFWYPEIKQEQCIQLRPLQDRVSTYPRQIKEGTSQVYRGPGQGPGAA